MILLELLEPQYGAKPAEVHYLEGFLRYHGLGIPQDFVAAFRHCEIAANAGLPAAQYLAGKMLIEKTGVAQDIDAGFAFLRSASGQSFVPATLLLAMLISHSESDNEEVFTLNEVAANLGAPNAAHALAVAYEEGRGVAKSERNALHWYERAALLGDCFASQRLERAYVEGHLGLQVDMDLAYKWATKAEAQRVQMEADEFERYKIGAANGHRASQTLLAMIFKTGVYGVKIDLVASKYWEQLSKE